MTDYKLAQKRIIDELAQCIRQVDGDNKMGAEPFVNLVCQRPHIDVQGGPEGATHYRPSTGVYYQVMGGKTYAWREARAGWLPSRRQGIPDDCVRLATAEQKPTPDVSGLVEALERIANMDSMSYHSPDSAKITARAALADYQRLQADHERLQAECEKLRKDAERYRWLAATNSGPIGIVIYDEDGGMDIAGPEAGKAIDAAMQGDQP